MGGTLWRMRNRWLFVAALVAASEVEAARIVFTRTVPPKHVYDAPSNRIALLRMEGRTAECAHVFLRIEFRDSIKATGATLEDVSHLKTTIEGRRAGAPPSDLYLQSEDCVCQSAQRPVGNGTSWYAGACRARVRLTDASGRDLGVVTVDGKSEEKTDVVDFAAHISAGREMMRQLAKMIRPHQSRLVIDTDRDVPGEKQAAKLLKKNDYAGARAIWERELVSAPNDAALHFAIAGTADAMGDVDAARKHYEEAVRLAPDNERYARFKGYFEARVR